MPRLLVIDDRDQTVEMVHRQLPQFDTVTRCDRRIPCQVCEERTRGCPLRCAHDYAEAAEALARQGALPDLVVLDLHFALPEERLLPEDKSALPAEPKARRAAVEGLRRRQGLLILERLRATYPTAAGRHAHDDRLGPRRRAPRRSAGLPVRERGGRQPQPGRRDLARARAPPQRAGGADLLGARPGHGRAAPAARACSRARRCPLLIEGETGTGKSFLAEHVIHPRSGAKGPLVVTDLSTVPPRAAGRAPVRRAARRLHGRRRGSRRRVRAGPRRDAVPRRDRQPRSRAAAAAPARARARRGHPPRRHAPAAGGAQAGRGDERGRRGAGARGTLSLRPLHAPQPGHAAARAAAARAARGSSRSRPLRVPRGAALRAAAAAGARVPGPLPHARTTSPTARAPSCSAGRARPAPAATPSRCSSAARRSHA